MEVGRTGIQPRAERHEFKRKVELRIGDGTRIEAESEDISFSGMALSMNAPAIDNGAFVELHAEGLGTVSAKIARTYEGGAAVQFSELLNTLPAGTAGTSVDRRA